MDVAALARRVDALQSSLLSDSSVRMRAKNERRPRRRPSEQPRAAWCGFQQWIAMSCSSGCRAAVETRKPFTVGGAWSYVEPDDLSGDELVDGVGVLGA